VCAIKTTRQTSFTRHFTIVRPFPCVYQENTRQRFSRVLSSLCKGGDPRSDSIFIFGRIHIGLFLLLGMLVVKVESNRPAGPRPLLLCIIFRAKWGGGGQGLEPPPSWVWINLPSTKHYEFSCLHASSKRYLTTCCDDSILHLRSHEKRTRILQLIVGAACTVHVDG
jgi:hypothetical protein